jgi:hypothetical protein
MGKSTRHEQLLSAVCRQSFPDPVPVPGRSGPQIDRDVIYASVQHTDKLCLRGGRQLEMQTADRAALGREGLIVLDKPDRDSGGLKCLLVIGFDKYPRASPNRRGRSRTNQERSKFLTSMGNERIILQWVNRHLRARTKTFAVMVTATFVFPKESARYLTRRRNWARVPIPGTAKKSPT